VAWTFCTDIVPRQLAFARINRCLSVSRDTWIWSHGCAYACVRARACACRVYRALTRINLHWLCPVKRQLSCLAARKGQGGMKEEGESAPEIKAQRRIWKSEPWRANNNNMAKNTIRPKEEDGVSNSASRALPVLRAIHGVHLDATFRYLLFVTLLASRVWKDSFHLVYILVQYSCRASVRDVHPRLCSAWRSSELQKNSLR